MPRLNLKYIIALILGFSLSAPYFTNFICFKQDQLTHRKSIKMRFNASLDIEEFEKFIFSPSEFKELDWDGEDEFYLSQRKYDLFKVEKKGDSLIAWAWWDHTESDLEERFHQMLHHNQNRPLKDKPTVSLDKLSKYLAELNSSIKYFASADERATYFALQKISPPFIDLASPPPLCFK
jgi:hypothetical protein